MVFGSDLGYERFLSISDYHFVFAVHVRNRCNNLWIQSCIYTITLFQISILTKLRNF